MDPASSDPTSSGSHAIHDILRDASPIADTPGVSLLATLEKAVSNLQGLPDATETDEIAAFTQSVPTDLAKDDAWEYLDPMLNRFLGFNRPSKSISKAL